jgi:hypothetical protein
MFVGGITLAQVFLATANIVIYGNAEQGSDGQIVGVLLDNILMLIVSIINVYISHPETSW